MKKIVNKAASLVLVFVMLFSTVTFARAQDGIEIAVSNSSTTISAGTMTTFTASIKNNTGIAGFVFDYEVVDEFQNDVTDCFTHTGYWLAPTGILLVNAGGYMMPIGTLTMDGEAINWNTTTDVTGDGNLLTMNLTPNQNLVDVKYAIRLKVTGDNVVTNAAGATLPVTYKAFEFTLTGGIPAENVTPTITAQPQSAGYKFGQAASELSVTASLPEGTVVTEPLAYQWYKVVEGGGDKAITGATNSTYKPILGEIGVGNSADYYCVVTSTYNGQKFPVKSSVATVTYSKGDSTPPELTSNTVTYGDTLNLVTKGGVGSSNVSFEIIAGEDVATLAFDLEKNKWVLTPIKVGTVTLKVTRAASDNYNGSTIHQTVTIAHANLTLTGNTSYNVTAYTTKKPVTLTVPTVTAKNGQTVTPAWAVTAGEGKITINTSGTVTVSATDSAAANDTVTVTLTYSAPNHNDKVVTYNITIKDKNDVKNKMSFTATGTTSADYDGNEKSVSTFVNAATIEAGYTGTITYTVENSAGETVASGSDLSALKVTNAGTYTVTATYSDDENEGALDRTFTINQAAVTAPTAKTGLVYNENTQTGVTYETGKGYTMSGDLSAADAGDYTATATLDGNHKWSDNTTDAKTIGWSIEQKPINVSAWAWSTTTSFTYNGSEHSVTLLNTNTDFDKVDVQYSDNTATDVGNNGSHTAGATVTVKSNYARNYKIEGTVPTCSWTLNPAEINVAGVSFTQSDISYNGQSHTVAVSSLPANVTVNYSGDVTKANVGNYSATATLSPASTNYTLNGTTTLNLDWKIIKATVAVPTAITGLVFDGTEKTGVADPAADAPYTVSGNKQTNAGTDYTATAVLKDKDNYEWIVDSGNTSADRTITWSIAKAAALTNLTNDQAQMRYDDADGLTIDGDSFITGGNVSFETSNITVDGDAKSALTVTADDNNVKITLNSIDRNNAGKTATIVVNFTTPNYEGANKMTITLAITSKTPVKDKITFAGGEVTYNGQAQKPADATISITPAGTPNWTYVFKDSGGNVVSEMKNAGTYTVTATYEDDDNYGTTDPVTFTIKQAQVTITGGTVADQEYDGDTAVDSLTAPTVTGTVNSESLTLGTDFAISNAKFENGNAGNNKAVTYSVALKNTAKANNYVLTAARGSTTGNITRKGITVTVGAIAALTYTGVAQTPAVTVSATGTINSYTLVKDTDYTVTYAGNTNAGTATATVSTKDGSNYTFTAAEKNFTINKVALTIDSVAIADKVYDTTDTATATAVAFTGLVNSETLTLGTDYTVTATFDNANVGGGQTVNYTVTLADTAKAGNYTLTSGTGSATADITKATPTGEPAYTAINAANKTLADAELEIGTLTPTGGTLIWVDGDGNELAADTKVEANKAYTWKYTPSDTANYNVLTGTVTLYQYIPYIPPVGNAIVVNTPANQNGTVQLSTANAVPGATVFITATPKEGYTVGKLVVTDQNGNVIPVTDLGNGKYSFTMPAGKVSINAEFEETVWNNPFTDVPETEWYYSSVKYVQTKGLMNGVGDGEFAPTANLTRAMLMTMLARLSGVDTTGGATWYEKGLNWAKENKISDGSAPMSNITRQEIVVMLYRYMGEPEVSDGYTKGFPDHGKIDSWAEKAMKWAVSVGILGGDDRGYLNPVNTATRAEVAAMIARFAENVLN